MSDGTPELDRDVDDWLKQVAARAYIDTTSCVTIDDKNSELCELVELVA